MSQITYFLSEKFYLPYKRRPGLMIVGPGPAEPVGILAEKKGRLEDSPATLSILREGRSPLREDPADGRSGRSDGGPRNPPEHPRGSPRSRRPRLRRYKARPRDPRPRGPRSPRARSPQKRLSRFPRSAQIPCAHLPPPPIPTTIVGPEPGR